MIGPRVLVAILCAVNLATGLALGAGVDRRCGGGEHRAHGREHCEKAFERMRTRLALDDKQAEKVRAIFDARRPELDKIRAEGRARMDAFRATTDAELSKVLTPDQMTRLAELRKEREHEHRGDAPPGAP